MSLQARVATKQRLQDMFPEWRFKLQAKKSAAGSVLQRKEIYCDCAPKGEFALIANEYSWQESFTIARNHLLALRNHR